MWEQAYTRVSSSVHSIFTNDYWEEDGETYWHPLVHLGSCFLINTKYQFLTCAHVVIGEPPERPIIDPLRIIIHVPGTVPKAPHLGEVIAIDRDLDLAVVQTPADDGAPAATFAGPDELAAGSPIASIGYPFSRTTHTRRGEAGSTAVEVHRRLSAGFVSGDAVFLRLTGSPTPRKVCEANLFSYEGNSGGACFDVRGRIVGMNSLGRGEIDAAAAGYSYSARNQEIMSFLDRYGIGYTVEV